MPAPFDKEETKERLRKLQGGPSAPLNVHLRQEIDRLNIILRLTSSTLKNLRLAVAGTSCCINERDLDSVQNAEVIRLKAQG